VNRHDLDRRAALARAVPLETVLVLCGALRDRHDQSKWHTQQGPLSVTGAKFMNWARSQGGGGAIDLVMHLLGLGFRAAVEWLESHVGTGYVGEEPVGSGQIGAAKNVAAERAWRSSAESECPVECRVDSAGADPLRLPPREDCLLPRVHEYLTTRRKLSSGLLEPVLRSGRLYADQRGNAVFLLVRGKPNQAVGAELRGTGPRVWRGMAGGSRKDLGYFWVGEPTACELVLCESAIDALSCFQLLGSRLCLSTSGVRANPGWLPGLITRGYRIHCGFDTDEAGEEAASQMTAHYPSITRLRPPAHDWNDALTSCR
jgi:hypothetical protein